MKTLVIYDSYFGNTEKIAQAIGRAAGSKEAVKVLRVGDVKPEQLRGVTLLIVGSPTRAFRPTKAISGLLKGLANTSLSGVKAMAFDTRVSVDDTNSRFLKGMVKLFGYGAEPIGKQLVKKGAQLIDKPQGFFVADSEGPLKNGELERAAAWVKQAIKAL